MLDRGQGLNRDVEEDRDEGERDHELDQRDASVLLVVRHELTYVMLVAARVGRVGSIAETRVGIRRGASRLWPA